MASDSTMGYFSQWTNCLPGNIDVTQLKVDTGCNNSKQIIISILSNSENLVGNRNMWTTLVNLWAMSKFVIVSWVMGVEII